MNKSAFASFSTRRDLNIRYFGIDIVEMIERNDFQGALDVNLFKNGFSDLVVNGLIDADFVYSNLHLIDTDTLRALMIRSHDECTARNAFYWLRDRDPRLFLTQQEMTLVMNRIREDLYFEYKLRTMGEEKPERVWPVHQKQQFNAQEPAQMSLF